MCDPVQFGFQIIVNEYTSIYVYMCMHIHIYAHMASVVVVVVVMVWLVSRVRLL